MIGKKLLLVAAAAALGSASASSRYEPPTSPLDGGVPSRDACPWDPWRALVLALDPPLPTGTTNDVVLPNIAKPGEALSLTVRPKGPGCGSARRAEKQHREQSVRVTTEREGPETFEKKWSCCCSCCFSSAR